jgi:hypothetical protein
MPTKTPVLFCDDGSERELPFKWEICGGCRGHGTSSAYLGAFTREEMDEQGPEFLEDYMAGRYDRECDHCSGLGRVKRADLSRMSKEDRAAYREQQRGFRDMEAEERAERRFGC